MSATLFLFVVAVATVAEESKPANSSPPADAPPVEASAKAIAEFKADAAAYVMRLEGRADWQLKLREEPLLHWGNPARNGENGAVFVWMLEGRPEVIGSMFSFSRKDGVRTLHEYHSLSPHPLTADYGNVRAWAPSAAGVEWHAILDAPVPAGSPRLRLTQMKALAREFSAKIIDRQNQKNDLRLVPQPLLRYEPTNESAVDGALFSFSLGTDPEVILLLEARRAKEQTVWNFALARFHFVDLTAFYKGNQVWHVDTIADMAGIPLGSEKYQESPYAIYRAKFVPSEE
jgi:hypothetical protein